MPEGHTIHRLAADIAQRFGGAAVSVTSPQGRFADSARLLDGNRLLTAEAHGKHLLLGFAADRWTHIHLGLYGKVRFGTGAPPDPPIGEIRLRLARHDGTAWLELRGPNRCELITDQEKAAVHARLGPDPLRPPGDPFADPEPAWKRINRSRTPLAALLMDQHILSGVGNIYRAEVLFRQGIDPRLPGNRLSRLRWQAVWNDLAELMAAGVTANRIDTVRPEHTPEATGRAPRVDKHGGEVYVYRRAAMPCLICATPVATGTLATRNLYWCPTCQPVATT